jgi:hypothetical protein
MLSFFRQSFRMWARSTEKAGETKQPAGRLQCEALEDRVVPSLVSSTLLVNATKAGVQSQAATATSGNGASVVVWTQAKAGIDRDIRAQRFDAAGKKVGSEMLIAGGMTPQHSPSVAMDGRGNFAVAWTHEFSSTDKDIHAALFSSSGRRVGSEKVVARAPKNEYDASVAMASNGNFVVSYSYQFSASDADIKAVQYRADGTAVRTLNVADSARNETKSSAAMTADGRFAVTFVKSDDIVVRRYTKDGASRDIQTIAGGANPQREPHAVMDAKGNTFVAWQESVRSNWNVYVRAIRSDGSLKTRATVQATSAYETLPSVAVDSLTGRTVVAYQSQSGTTTSVKVTELSAAGVHLRTATMGGGLAAPSVSLGGTAHRYLLAARSLGAKGLDPDGGIFYRLGVL